MTNADNWAKLKKNANYPKFPIEIPKQTLGVFNLSMDIVKLHCCNDLNLRGSMDFSSYFGVHEGPTIP